MRDTSRLFAALQGLPRRVFLDSAVEAGGRGRHDLIAADPYLILTSSEDGSRLAYRDRSARSGAEPVELLRAELDAPSPTAAPVRLGPGAIGYFAYDLGRRLERLPSRAEHAPPMPQLCFGFYDWVVSVDHMKRRAWLLGGGRDPVTAVRWAGLRSRLERPPPAAAGAVFRARSPITADLDRAAYARAFARIKDHIRRGDCYQVNLARRFTVETEGDPWRAYLALRRSSPAPYAAYLETAEGTILSSSPESFLSLHERRVVTKPIKGTRRRARDPEHDAELARELAASPKDRAENVMIVDLLRNDLGKSCEPGSVRVRRLFDVESYANVHQLVSTVTGRLRRDCDALDLLAGCFPGGSITGAPKLAAMAIIEGLEPHRRGVYCGAIGHLGFDGGMELSIAIRTLLHRQGRAYFWAGGGIVADSEVDAEYQETLDKASALLALFDGSAA